MQAQQLRNGGAGVVNPILRQSSIKMQQQE